MKNSCKYFMYGKLIIVLLVFSFFALGCNTAKGFSEDCKGLWQGLKKADAWFKEKAW